MTSFADRLDVLLRRNRKLPRLPWLRNLLRKPYHRLLGLSGQGLELELGGVVQVRLPVEYCAVELETYEVETVRAIAAWTERNPGGLFVDIGCSHGYLSCAVRFLDPDADVIALDADLPSVEVAGRVCRYAPEGAGSLRRVLALVGERSSEAFDLAGAVSRTDELLTRSRLGKRDIRTNYVCLDTRIDEDTLPRTTLDDLLLADSDGAERPWLIKCDVEGAEESVLRGARGVLRRGNVTILLSVHPHLVGRYGGSVSRISALLEDAGYTRTILGIDHEEHWLCEPRAR